KRSHDEVDTAGLQVKIMLFRGLVFTDVDIVLEVFVEQRQAQRSRLDADGATLDFSRYFVDCLLGSSFILGEIKGFAGVRQLRIRAVLQRSEGLRRQAVGNREADGFFALRRSGKASHDRI